MTRRLRFRLAAALAVALVAVAAGMLRPPPEEERSTLYVFGTLVEVVIHGESRASAQAGFAALSEDFRRYHHDWHAWQPGELEDLNAAIAAGRGFDADPDLAALLRQGQALTRASGGLFDPGIGAMVELWGFHADELPQGAPPAEAAIAALVAGHPSMADLRFDGDHVTSVNPHVQLDLGAYAKGAALDRAEARLVSMGIENAVLNAGGGVNVIGRHGGRPWRVAVRDPFEWGVVGAVALQPGEAMHTSGNYERYLAHDGQRFSHILDPRTGRPVADVVSATVIAADGATADAVATALNVAGVAGWAATAAAMGVETALLIDHTGRLFMTPAMAARLELVPGPGVTGIEVVALPAAAARAVGQ